MLRTIVVEGKTSTEAIEKGIKELNVSRNQVDVKILEEKKKSFFNILDPHMVKVEITVREENSGIKNKLPKAISKENIEEAKNRINIFLEEFLSEISTEIKYTIKNEENIINVEIGENASDKLIGYRGEILNALQLLLGIIANKGQENGFKVILDIGNYKEVRKKSLEELSVKIEKTVLKNGKSITLEPMTAYERKIIHTYLQDSQVVKTYSIGEGIKRRIVISKK